MSSSAAARRAFLEPTIVATILDFVAPSLCCCHFRRLQYHLVLDGGTAQIVKWLVSGRLHDTQATNHFVVIKEPDELTPTEDKVEEGKLVKQEEKEPVKWDASVLLVAMQKLKGTRVLWIRLESLRVIPAELLASPNLKGATLEIPVPLTNSPVVLPSQLNVLILHDRIDSCLRRFPHALTLIKSCHNLEALKLERFPEPALLLQLLEACPSPYLTRLSAEVLVGRLGAGLHEIHPDILKRTCNCAECEFEASDTVEELYDFLDKGVWRTRVREIVIDVGARVSEVQEEKLLFMAEMRGVKLCFKVLANGLSQAELDDMVERSARLFEQMEL
ncbi:hypothetical protein JCM8097_008939 [Rhodosporidiobolus ruineniae]